MFTSNRPTIDDFLRTYGDAIRGIKDARADFVEGSLYEQIGGVAAIVWSRLVQRDENLFSDTQTNSATGDALTQRVLKVFGVDRLLDAPGSGTIVVTRPSTGTGDTFWTGTRIEVVDRNGLSELSEYEISSDVPVVGSTTRVTLPIRAIANGPAVSVRVADAVYPRFADAIWDSTWTIEALDCDAGTAFEPAPVVRARARTSRLALRKGLPRAIIDACKSVGADQVVIFPSNFGGDEMDGGLNWVYVGDSSFNASVELIRNCKLALESARSLGDNLQVGPMVNTNLIVKADVFLNESPAKVNQVLLVDRLRKYVVAALKQDYTYSLDTFRGALYQASPLVQDVTFSIPSTDGTLLATRNGVLNFPASLTRYQLLPDNVTLTLRSPE